MTAADPVERVFPPTNRGPFVLAIEPTVMVPRTDIYAPTLASVLTEVPELKEDDPRTETAPPILKSS
jgi:hypothetical protein